MANNQKQENIKKIKCPTCGHNKFNIDMIESYSVTYRNCEIEYDDLYNNRFNFEYLEDHNKGLSDLIPENMVTCESCGSVFNYITTQYKQQLQHEMKHTK